MRRSKHLEWWASVALASVCLLLGSNLSRQVQDFRAQKARWKTARLETGNSKFEIRNSKIENRQSAARIRDSGSGTREPGVESRDRQLSAAAGVRDSGLGVRGKSQAGAERSSAGKAAELENNSALPAIENPKSKIENVTPLGYVEKAGGQVEAVVADGDSVRLVHEGDVFDDHARVGKITASAVEIVREVPQAASPSEVLLAEADSGPTVAMRSGNSKFEIRKSEIESRGSRVQGQESKVESRKSNVEDRNSKLETPNSKLETGKSNLETGSSKLETGNRQPATGQSKIETRNSKLANHLPPRLPTPDSPLPALSSAIVNRQSAIDNHLLGYVEKADGQVQTIVADGEHVRLVRGDSALVAKATALRQPQGRNWEIEIRNSKLETGSPSRLPTPDSRLPIGDSGSGTRDSGVESRDRQLSAMSVQPGAASDNGPGTTDNALHRTVQGNGRVSIPDRQSSIDNPSSLLVGEEPALASPDRTWLLPPRDVGAHGHAPLQPGEPRGEAEAPPGLPEGSAGKLIGPAAAIPSDVKFLGYVEWAQGKKEGVLAEGDHVLLVREGEMLWGRAQVTKVSPRSVEFVEIASQRAPPESGEAVVVRPGSGPGPPPERAQPPPVFGIRGSGFGSRRSKGRSTSLPPSPEQLSGKSGGGRSVSARRQWTESRESKVENRNSKLETRNSKLETGKSNLETGSSKLETGNRQLVTGNWQLESRLLGYVEMADGRRLAVLVDGDGIRLVGEGDFLGNGIRVASIAPEGVELVVASAGGGPYRIGTGQPHAISRASEYPVAVSVEAQEVRGTLKVPMKSGGRQPARPVGVSPPPPSPLPACAGSPKCGGE